MLIHIGYDIELGVTAPTSLIYTLQLHPTREKDLVEPERIVVTPELKAEPYQDAFDNRLVRLTVPAGVPSVRIRNSAYVQSSPEPDPVDLAARQHGTDELPVETLRYLLPSRYCEVDSELLQFAWNRFGSVPEGWGRVQAVVDYVHDHIRFDYMQARANRTALEAWREQVGVCRDFTHLAVTLCRCMNIPARYATGYLGDIGVPPVPDPMDFSAWFEVWLGDRWHTFDARHNKRRIGRIVIGYGRDATDVAITTVFGASRLNRFQVITEAVDPKTRQPITV